MFASGVEITIDEEGLAQGLAKIIVAMGDRWDPGRYQVLCTLVPDPKTWAMKLKDREEPDGPDGQP